MGGVIYSKGCETQCDIRLISCVRFSQWVLGAGMVRCAIRWGFCYLLRGVRGSVLGGQRCRGVREDVVRIMGGVKIM